MDVEAIRCPLLVSTMVVTDAGSMMMGEEGGKTGISSRAVPDP